MADIDLYQEDTKDSSDEDQNVSSIDLPNEQEVNTDEGLTNFQILEKYIDSRDLYSRQMVAHSLPETLRECLSNSLQEANKVLIAMKRLSDDSEPTVRFELMERLPNVADICFEARDSLNQSISIYLLPIIVKYLTDSNDQVRRTSQAALLVLMEQAVVDKDDVVNQVCPEILELTSSESIDDIRTEAVALICKIAPLLGKEITVDIFMHRFTELCTDAVFLVRKVCASNFGDFCNVVGQYNTEEFLLSRFFYLCEDGVWGVRKACADCFMVVSCVCSLEKRKGDLARTFINLILDQSRWVRIAAFQALGGFISTFADPSITGLYVTEDGKLCSDLSHELKRFDQHENKSTFPDSLSNTTSITGDTSSISMSKSPPEIDSASTDSSNDSIFTHPELPLSNETSSKNDLADASSCIASISSHCDTTSNDSNTTNDSVAKFPESNTTSTGPRFHAGLELPLTIDTSFGKSDVVNYSDSEKSFNNHSTSFYISNELSSTDQTKLATSPVNPPLHTKDTEESDPRANTDQSSTQYTNLDRHDKVEKQEALSTDSVEVSIAENESNNAFNTFQFWRPSLPPVDLDVAEQTNADIKQNISDAQQLLSQLGVDSNCSLNDIHTANVVTFNSNTETVTNIGSTHVLGLNLNEATFSTDLSDTSGETDQKLNTNSEDHFSSFNDSVQDNNLNFNGVSFSVSDSSFDNLKSNPDNSASLSQMESAFISSDDNDLESGDDRRRESNNNANILQDVIPQQLLDHYLSMIDPLSAQTVDAEIARHCAYSLPAVAFTLGRQHWPCLKHLYETLANDMQWKVRRTLAFSIHELGMILGCDITGTDLIPIFDGFLKDLDEVRLGVLKHLADFLKLLTPDKRDGYLSKLGEFLNTDNNRNWRFREEIAQQLILLVNLFSPREISLYLSAICFTLCTDRVSEVRQTAFLAMSRILAKLNQSDSSDRLLEIINEMVANFAQSSRWNRRQIFAQLCYNILIQQAINVEIFSKNLLPSLLSLHNDPIPNIRISVSRTLSQLLSIDSGFQSPSINPHIDELFQTVEKLKVDTDRDVRNLIINKPLTTDDSKETV